MILSDKLKPYRLLLASQSPRRRELMTGCGLPYELAPKYDCEEVYPADLPAEEVPLYLSQLKSRAWPGLLAPDMILLTADTVVVLDGEVLGKPRGRDEAVKMLGRLSGRRHTVVSGVTLRTAETTCWRRCMRWRRACSMRSAGFSITGPWPVSSRVRPREATNCPSTSRLAK